MITLHLAGPGCLGTASEPHWVSGTELQERNTEKLRLSSHSGGDTVS